MPPMEEDIMLARLHGRRQCKSSTVLTEAERRHLRSAPLRNAISARRNTAIEALFAQICRATPGEARGSPVMLTVSERPEVTLFRYTRVHAHAISTACTRESSLMAGGHGGAALNGQTEGKDDAWGVAAVSAKKPVPLAG